jgi:hypothetical protein
MAVRLANSPHALPVRARATVAGEAVPRMLFARPGHMWSPVAAAALPADATPAAPMAPDTHTMFETVFPGLEDAGACPGARQGVHASRATGREARAMEGVSPA